ncbi:MAG: ABC transporter substrate-binding protein [Hyphomicrobiaceae bacterium]|nr:ABC transporter substrate-binding protein [Hyphomicrobiaceae bacterium]
MRTHFALTKYLGLVCALVAYASAVLARPLDEVVASKTLRVVVYRDNPPFSWMEGDQPRGIDVDIGKALARHLGVEPEIVARMTAEDVDDDLRFNIWKGPYSEGGVGDVMLHVPVDRDLMARNNLAVISNAYFMESVALAIDPDRQAAPTSFDAFTEAKIGVQFSTVEDYFLLRFGNGKLISNIAHHTKLEKGIDAFLKKDTVAILGVRSDIEGMLNRKGAKARFVDVPMPGLARKNWLIGTAVKDDSRDLGYAIGAAFEKMRTSGDLQNIFSSYGVTYVSPATPD